MTTRFEFAFPHSKGEPWWLTDGAGRGREVSRLVWFYYRLGRRWRTARVKPTATGPEAPK